LLRATLDRWGKKGWAIWYPEFLGSLAEGLAATERFPEALAAIEEALDRSDRHGERWYLPELLRVKGELLIQCAGDEGSSTAERFFLEAIEVSRRQGALFWELRAALSLARMRVMHDQPDDARRTLAPVFDRFTEGFDTVDMRSARAVLDSLAPHRT
jgi:predicted ATPase